MRLPATMRILRKKKKKIFFSKKRTMAVRPWWFVTCIPKYVNHMVLEPFNGTEPITPNLPIFPNRVIQTQSADCDWWCMGVCWVSGFLSFQQSQTFSPFNVTIVGVLFHHTWRGGEIPLWRAEIPFDPRKRRTYKGSADGTNYNRNQPQLQPQP